MLDRRPAADPGGRPLGRVVRPLRPSGALVDPGAARRPGRGIAGRPVGDRHRGLRRGDGVPSRRGERSHSRLVRADSRTQSDGSCSPGRDPARLHRLPRRRGVPVPAHPDPRCRLSVAFEGHLRRPARALRRMARARGRGETARVRGDRRLPPGAGVSMPRRDRIDRHTRRPRSRPDRHSGSSRQVEGRWRGATFLRRSASSSEPRICSRSTHRDVQRFSRSWGLR